MESAPLIYYMTFFLVYIVDHYYQFTINLRANTMKIQPLVTILDPPRRAQYLLIHRDNG